ncbi:MAG: L-arabinose isomerase, partial [Anaerolineales bacterium]|nr:L-arabinose isomerase [Anaerolineales bacterium]
MEDLKQFEVWFVTGSQDLYGEETLKQVAEDSRVLAQALDQSAQIPVRVVFKPVLTTPDAVTQLCMETNAAKDCIGLITWMHTFSPAKMWIAGLNLLRKPFVHLHTQFNRDIPWSQIDMDFMNLNQSAHGGREYGFIGSRMRKERKVVIGHWQDPEVSGKIELWLRVAAAWYESQNIKIARFGDNMREVAVTEGDKVEAQLKFGWSVNGYGVGELVAVIEQVTDKQIDQLCEQLESEYKMQDVLKKGGENHPSLRESARIEIGLR